MDFRGFYSRRIRRLLPALALVVCVTSVIAIFMQRRTASSNERRKRAGAMLLSANVVIPRLSDNYFAVAATANPLLHTWSLSAETFYLAFPALLLLGLACTPSRAFREWGPIVVAGVSAASVVLLLVSTYAPLSVASLGVLAAPFYSSLTRAWEFGAGALVALTAGTVPRCPPRLLLIGGLAGIAIVLVSAARINESTTFPGVVAFVPVFGAALILASGVAEPNALVRALSIRPLVWVGDLSTHGTMALAGNRVRSAALPGVARIAMLTQPPRWFALLSLRFVENRQVLAGCGRPTADGSCRRGFGYRSCRWNSRPALVRAGASRGRSAPCRHAEGCIQVGRPIRCTWSTRARRIASPVGRLAGVGDRRRVIAAAAAWATARPSRLTTPVHLQCLTPASPACAARARRCCILAGPQADASRDRKPVSHMHRW